MLLHGQTRSAYTLLEVIVASALALILMGALYVALDVQLRLANAGRDALDEAILTRALVQRIENDLNAALTPVAPPKESEEDPLAGILLDETIPVIAGVVGSVDTLVIYVAKPTTGRVTVNYSVENAENMADIRRIVYWMAPTGLARQEVPWVTSEVYSSSTEPVILDDRGEDAYVIAQEVTEISFEYFDGSAWTDYWDGAVLDEDGLTPIGPPAAIRIRMFVLVAGPQIGQKIEKEVVHVVALSTAPGPSASALDPLGMEETVP